jgi:hypothetical protein
VPPTSGAPMLLLVHLFSQAAAPSMPTRTLNTGRDSTCDSAESPPSTTNQDMALNPTTPSSSPPNTPGACLDKTCELEPTWRHWKSRSLVSERNVQELRDRMNKLQSEFDVHRRKSNIYIPSAAHGEEKRTIEMRSRLRQLTKTWKDDME